MQVGEIFTGLPAGTKEVVVGTWAPWMKRGRSYLIDVIRNEAGNLHLARCGASAEVTATSPSEDLEYLRQRAKGTAKTTLAIHVSDQYMPVSGAVVKISGPDGDLKSLTSADGIATFSEIAPAKYRVEASKSE